MGRDKSHASDLTPDIRANAETMVRCANVGMAMFYADVPNPQRHKVNSGWRPPSINATAPGAAQHSAHLLAMAVDLEDTDDSELCRWSLRNQARLIKIGIVGMERPEATVKKDASGVIVARWCHWQMRPLGSGVFCFWPTQTAYNDWKASGEPLIVG